MYDLTGFQRDLLYVIADADQPSGQDVKEDLDTDPILAVLKTDD